MRTSISLDVDVYEFASAYAGAKGITLAAAINELVRRGERVQEAGGESPRLKLNKHGYFEIVAGGELTAEMVKKLSEDENA